MKKKYKAIRKLLFVTMLFLSFVSISFSTAYADLDLEHYSWSDKLSRGAINMVSSPVEVGRSISVTSQEEGRGYGWTVGLLKGCGMAVVRFGAGFIEVVTFPFDFPDEDKAPLVQPEYPSQKWSGDYTS